MIKIEKLSPDADVWFVRGGVRQRAFLHQLLSHSELPSLEVLSGSVVYSIDEQDVITQQALEPTKSVEPTNSPAVEPPTPATPPVAATTEAKPKIVFPKKRK